MQMAALHQMHYRCACDMINVRSASGPGAWPACAGCAGDDESRPGARPGIAAASCGGGGGGGGGVVVVVQLIFARIDAGLNAGGV